MTAPGEASPTFSVITIFHNEERFLADAVASVAAQTGPMWELILIDDGSTDRSGDIARTLATSFPDWIRYMQHPDRSNRGMSASRNLGIETSRGEWITFLDADDTWMPGKIAAQLELLHRHPEVGVLASPACWWRSWKPGNTESDWTQNLLSGADLTMPLAGADGSADHRVVAPPELVTMFLADEWLSICDLVVRRDLVTAVGGYEPNFTGMFEDQVFHTKVLSRFPAVVTRDSWYRYRQHGAACTSTTHGAGGHAAARNSFLLWAERHLLAVDRPATVGNADWKGLIDLIRHQRRQAGLRRLRDWLPSMPAGLRRLSRPVFRIDR